MSNTIWEAFYAIIFGNCTPVWQQPLRRLINRSRQGDVSIFYKFTRKAAHTPNKVTSEALIETTDDVADDLAEFYSVRPASKSIYKTPDGVEFIVEKRGRPVRLVRDSAAEFVSALRNRGRIRSCM